MRAAVVVVIVAGCTADAVVVTPVIDLPANDTASAFPLDNVTVSIAHEGDALDITAATFTHGQAINLSGAPFADDLVIHMTGTVGTSDVAYGRTCSFAVAQGEPVPSPHLFFSRSVKFADTTYTSEPRVDGAAVTYHDGSGLLLGGVDPNDTTANTDIERFDPRTGQFELLATFTHHVTSSVAVALGLGSEMRVALVGGLDLDTNAGAQFVQLVDADNPIDRRTDVLDNTNMSRIDLTATSLSDGTVIVIGGRAPGTTTPAADVDLISETNGQAQVQLQHAQLTYPRYQHTATRLGSDVGAPVLVAGGLDGETPPQPVPVAELYKPLSESFSPTASYHPTMVIPRSHHQTVLMPDGSALIIGGYDKTGTPVSTLELFTLDGGFQLIGQTTCAAGDTCPDGSACPTTGTLASTCATQLPADAGLVDFTATTLPDGRVLLAGGSRDGTTPVDTAFIATLDAVDGAVEIVATDQLAVARTRHQATLLCDGTVLLSGGTTTPVVAERYNPPAAGRR